MTSRSRRSTWLMVVCLAVFALNAANAQSSSIPITTCPSRRRCDDHLTYGQLNDILMATFSLLPRWSLHTQTISSMKTIDATTNDGYSASLYCKWMMYETQRRPVHSFQGWHRSRPWISDECGSGGTPSGPIG